MKYINNDTYKKHSLFTGVKTFNPLIEQKTKKYINL